MFSRKKNEGVDSRVYSHFGSAPVFAVVDMETNDVSMIPNKDQYHTHGACNPIRALGDQEFVALVAGGRGGGALRGLNQSGVGVYQAQAPSINENIAMFRNRTLPGFAPQRSCGGHKEGEGCTH
jgi:predicted Fe-Mo cluster-binding NifX family protein